MAGKKCSIDGCEQFTRMRGWCPKHYMRWLRHGDPLTILKRSRPSLSPELIRATDLQRYWEQVEVRGPDECWPWLGKPNQDGYGVYHGSGFNNAHRFAYDLAYGGIPDGLEVDHLCHLWDESCDLGIDCPHRRCQNPAHMEAVTHKENLARSVSSPSRRTHCNYGHALTGDNVTLRKSGACQCRACKRRKSAEEYQRKKARRLNGDS